MARRISVVVSILLLVAGTALAASSKMEARVYVTDAEATIHRMGDLFGELDIVFVGATPQGENYLLIDTDVNQLAAIQSLGFRTEITFKDLRDKFKLVTGYWPESDVGRNFGYFFTYYEMHDTILRLAQNYPAVVRIDSSMMSFHNHPLYCVKISDNPGTTENEPQVFINAATHAREPLGTHAAIVFATQLCRNYGSDSMTTWLVNNREIYIIPVMNPDGYIYNSDSGGTSSNWRKNRNNTSPRTGPGVDLNRNYGYKWGYDNSGSSPTPSNDVYRGPARFSEPETQAARDFMAAHKFRTQQDFHTYGRYNLHSYGYANVIPRDSMPFKEIADTFRLNNGYTQNGSIYRVLYAANGGSTDWESADTLQGSKFYTYAMSSELGTTDFWYGVSNPSYVDAEVALNVPNCFYLTRIAGVYLDSVSGGRVINDTASGNSNGQLDPGETANIWFSIRNRAIHPLDTAKSVTAVLRSSDTMVEVLTSTASFPSINPRRGTSQNGASQFHLRCRSNALPGTIVQLRLEVTCSDDGVMLTQALNYRVVIGNSPVLTHDVGVTRILVPGDTIDSTAAVAPACSVYNYGTGLETYRVRCTIGAVYNESTLVSSHPAGQPVYVAFPGRAGWNRSTGVLVACSTRLSGDAALANDRKTRTTFVRVLDVAALVISPDGTIDSGPPLSPGVQVRNNGNTTRNLNVALAIAGNYSSTQAVTALTAGETRTVAGFAPWQPARGSFSSTCTTKLAGDMIPGNNWHNGTILVRVRDLGATQVVAPAGTIPPGPVTPEARVRNFGTLRETCRVFFRINSSPAYFDSVTLGAGLPYADTTVRFAPWNAVPGNYVARCSTFLAGDGNRSNDAASGTFSVSAPPSDSHPNVEPMAIIAPVGTYESSFAIAPTAVLVNHGPGAATLAAIFQLDSGATHTVFYNQDSLITLSSPDTITIEFPEWVKPHPYGSYNVLCSVSCARDTHHLDDTKRCSFVLIHSGVLEFWTRLVDLPTGPRNKNVKDGGALSATEDGDSSFVYAFKGNNTREFYRYNAPANTWVARESIPALNRVSKKKGVKKGSSLAMAGNSKLYGTKGNNTLDWWQYDPLSRVWTQRADVPTGAKNCKEGVGSAAVTVGGSDYVYLLRGSSTFDFFRYDVAANSWDITLPTAPGGLSGKPYKNGSSIAWDGSDTIYCLKGSYNEFAAYSISGRTWVTRETLPRIAPPGTKKTKVKDGSGMAAVGRMVYALKGGNSNEFWYYPCDSHRWFHGLDMTAGPKKVKGGGALVYLKDNSRLYAFRGNNTREFWSYAPVSGYGAQSFANNELKGVQGQAAVPNSQFALCVSPNPVKDRTVISYDLSLPTRAKLAVYDVHGRLIRELLARRQPAGHYQLAWDRLDVHGRRVTPGVYFCRLSTGDRQVTAKLLLVD